MNAFYVMVECPNCDEEVYTAGLVVTTLEHRGRPVISVDTVSQLGLDCEGCGARIYTGDVDVEFEGGSDSSAEEDE